MKRKSGKKNPIKYLVIFILFSSILLFKAAHSDQRKIVSDNAPPGIIKDTVLKATPNLAKIPELYGFWNPAFPAASDSVWHFSGSNRAETWMNYAGLQMKWPYKYLRYTAKGQPPNYRWEQDQEMESTYFRGQINVNVSSPQWGSSWGDDWRNRAESYNRSNADQTLTIYSMGRAPEIVSETLPGPIKTCEFKQKEYCDGRFQAEFLIYREKFRLERYAIAGRGSQYRILNRVISSNHTTGIRAQVKGTNPALEVSVHVSNKDGKPADEAVVDQIITAILGAAFEASGMQNPCGDITIPEEDVEQEEENPPPVPRGQFVGYISSAYGETWIEREGQRLPAKTGTPVYDNDIVGTREGSARVAIFPRGLFDRALSTFEAPVFDKYGNRRQIVEYPIPTEGEAVGFISSMPPKLQHTYLSAISQVGPTFYLGEKTRISLAGAAWGQVRFTDFLLGGRPKRLPPGGIPDGLRVARDSEGWYMEHKNGVLLAALGFLFNPVRQIELLQERWQPWLRTKSDQEREELERWRKDRALEMGNGQAAGGVVLIPRGTEYAIESDPQRGRFFVGVNGGTVECIDLQSGMAVSLKPGEKLTAGNGESLKISPMTMDEWQSVAGKISSPEEASTTTAEDGNWDIPFLSADVSSVRLFESGADLSPIAERVYKDRFIASDTRFICWELALVFPEAAKRQDFQIEAHFRNQEGKVIFKQVHDVLIMPGWSNSVHARGWGGQEQMKWYPGRYRVDLYFRGQFIGCRSFEVAGGEPMRGGMDKRTYDVPAIQANVSSVRFYEGGNNTPTAKERIYSTRFSQATTRYVWWELSLIHPAPGKRRDFGISQIWRREDGSILANQEMGTFILDSWINSEHCHSWGSSMVPNWQPGRYSLELYIHGEMITQGSFEIY